MRYLPQISAGLLSLMAWGCTPKTETQNTADQPGFSLERAAQKPSTDTAVAPNPASTRIVLDQKGVGPVQEVTLVELNPPWAEQGKQLFEQKCHACHRADRKFIGPSLSGVLQRRNPVWVMNMILNPDQMVQKDPLAQELFMEFNGSPMTDLNLTEDQARTILEYFRTL